MEQPLCINVVAAWWFSQTIINFHQRIRENWRVTWEEFGLSSLYMSGETFIGLLLLSCFKLITTFTHHNHKCSSIITFTIFSLTSKKGELFDKINYKLFRMWREMCELNNKNTVTAWITQKIDVDLKLSFAPFRFYHISLIPLLLNSTLMLHFSSMMLCVKLQNLPLSFFIFSYSEPHFPEIRD